MSKKKLTISGLLLVNSLLVASLSMTLAWYGYSSSLSVDSIDITFSGEKNLLIGYSPDDLHESIGDINDEPVDAFMPVSSMYTNDELNAGATKPLFTSAFSRPSIDRPNSYKKPAIATSGFYQKDIYLYSDDNITVTFDDTEPFLVPDVKRNEKTAKAIANEQSLYPDEEQKLLESLNKVVLSMRVMIYDPIGQHYDIYSNYSPTTYFAGRLALFNDKMFDYYHKDGEKYEFVYGNYENEDKIVYDDPLPEKKYHGNGSFNAFNAYTQKGVHAFNLEKSLANGFKPKREFLDEPSYLNLSLKAHEPRKINVSVYSEGWDKGNTDAIKYGSFICNLKFKIKPGAY